MSKSKELLDFLNESVLVSEFSRDTKLSFESSLKTIFEDNDLYSISGDKDKFIISSDGYSLSVRPSENIGMVIIMREDGEEEEIPFADLFKTVDTEVKALNKSEVTSDEI